MNSRFYANLAVFVAVVIPFFMHSHFQEAEKILLHENWTFKSTDTSAWRPAQVPGTVHTDLMALGVIGDPFYADNELRQAWIEGKDWEYKLEFEMPESFQSRDGADLICEGLDTYADVYLNGKLVYEARNMFVAHEIKVKKLLHKGKNELKIVFRSPVKVGQEKLDKNGYLIPVTNEYAPMDKRTYPFTRKAPYHYGWDCGPRLVTCGIYKPIYLRLWNKAYISDIYYSTRSISNESASLQTQLEIRSAVDQYVELKIKADERHVFEKEIKLKQGKHTYTFDFDIHDPKLWWCNGMGEPYLYKMKVEVMAEGNTLHQVDSRLGVRTIEVVQRPDGFPGKSFLFRLNGKDVFVKGSNLIPSDNLLTRVDARKYEKILKASVDANMNMLRVWGGAIYENDEFYELCDKYGIMVWQDFMFACAMSPGDSLHLQNLSQEFEYNIKRLRKYASVAMYCGNNENREQWFIRSWRQQFGITKEADSLALMSAYEKIFYDLLPQAIAKYDKDKYYWPCSPSGGYGVNDFKNDTTGDVHDWRIWFGKATFNQLIQNPKRFVSEWGLQSYPEWKTLKATMPLEALTRYDSPLLDLRQRSMIGWSGSQRDTNSYNGNDRVLEYIQMYYKNPVDFKSFIYLSQLMQAEGMRQIAEGHRTYKPYCMGTMYWQIDDCWPTISWSSLDYYLRWKASHYFIRDAYKKIRITGFAKKDAYTIYVLNDALEPATFTLKWQWLDMQGSVLKEETKLIGLMPNTNWVSDKMDLNALGAPFNIKGGCIRASISKEDSLWDEVYLYMTIPKELALKKPQVSLQYKSFDEGVEIMISANTLAKNVYLMTENTDGWMDRNFVDVMPNAPVRVRYYTKSTVDQVKQDVRVYDVYTASNSP